MLTPFRDIASKSRFKSQIDANGSIIRPFKASFAHILRPNSQYPIPFRHMRTDRVTRNKPFDTGLTSFRNKSNKAVIMVYIKAFSHRIPFCYSVNT